LCEHKGRFVIIPIPNITSIFGRDVGCAIEQINLDSSIENISATEQRSSPQRLDSVLRVRNRVAHHCGSLVRPALVEVRLIQTT
jgi:hypothetical protein